MQVGQREKLLPLVIDTANKYQIDPKMLDAIIAKESTYDPYAIQYEPKYKWLTDPAKYAAMNKTSVEFEIELQKTSLGLAQIMGGTIRWLGHKKQLVRLFDPKENITFACLYIKTLQKRYSRPTDIISAYNAGTVVIEESRDYSNQSYVDSVLDWMKKLN